MSVFVIVLLLGFISSECLGLNLQFLSPTDITDIVDSQCVLVNTDKTNVDIIEILIYLEQSVFNERDGVVIGQINVDGFLWPDKTKPKFVKNKKSKVLLFRKVVKNRSCLMKTPKLKPEIIEFAGIVNGVNLVDLVNKYCFSYKTIDGTISINGLHRQDILQTLFHVSDISDKHMRKIHQNSDSMTCLHGDTSSCSYVGRSIFHKINIPQCERIRFKDTSNFFHDYLKISKPVIIEGAMKKWKSYKWSEKYLRQKYGNIDVHIKLTPTGEYEGVEPVNLWENYKLFAENIPKEVELQLLFPDLVVVRPATLNMKFSQFLDVINSISNNTMKNVSAYLEYSSIREYFPELESDIQEMDFIRGMLNLEHVNIWLSDGNTLGKTHFDPFDNFLCQLSGKKEVILFEPHNNSNLYEAHIPEAILSFDEKKMKFHRIQLSDSTSLVMSPVDILQPDFERFAKFADAYPINCTIGEGDVLFIPAFWWHEVQSYPSQSEGRNLAVNYWYEPFLTKEFPCQSCPLDVNPIYRHLL